jgi:hypothetical protein
MKGNKRGLIEINWKAKRLVAKIRPEVETNMAAFSPEVGSSQYGMTHFVVMFSWNPNIQVQSTLSIF